MKLPVPLVQLRAVVAKEVAQIGADTRLIRLLVGAPILQLLVFGAAVNFDIDHVPTAIVDRDDSARSRALAAELVADGTLDATLRTRDADAALRAMDEGRVSAVLILPEDLDAKRARGLPTPVQVVVDGTDARRSGVAASAASRFFASAEGAPAPAIGVAPRISANPTLDTQPAMVPGLAAMILVMTTTLVTAMGLAREREVGTLEQVLVTPIPPSLLLFGKVAPYVGIGVGDAGLALGFGALVFDVPMRGSLAFLFAATLAYLLSTVGAGLLVATFARTQQQAFMGGFFVMIPSMLLAGNLTPVLAMPAWMVPVTYVNPLRWYIEILRANLLEGSGPAELATPFAALLGIGAVLFVAATQRFRAGLAS